jgi:myo-inositol-1(or 4)-monophosphatase
MNKLNEAILYAAQMHSGQLRKGTNLPYIVHPMEVLNILIRMNAHEELLMAGVLHDVVEDTAATITDIAERFGDTVAELVNAHTEQNKELPWWERKLAAIEHLRTAPRDVKLLIMADKLSNLRSMDYDYSRIGDKLWDRFCADKGKQAWYYAASIDALENMADDPDGNSAYWELRELYARLFPEGIPHNHCPCAGSQNSMENCTN